MSDKQRILITDDSEMNRAILSEMLGDKYDILEAENGRLAVEIMQERSDIDLLLLDINMPDMDGFDVLDVMNKYHWIDDIPVIMISAENAASFVERAYNLGAVDYISRPFDMAVVLRRVVNTLMVYGKQKQLVQLVADQINEKEKSNNLMINILSHIVEFRNGESGQHVLHIHTATELILRHLVEMTDRYPLTSADIALISTASALHDIGKINIPESILNKPGKLTKEEFETMKTHTTIGARILKDLPFQQDAPLVKTAYEICRWHHERYDGRGYPDGLKGEDIPISAQVVALADVYDALTSVRCYKAAIDHDTALHMILNGECGAFNPLLMECLVDISEQLRTQVRGADGSEMHAAADTHQISDQLLHSNALPVKDGARRAAAVSIVKHDFYSSHVQSIEYDYSAATNEVTLTDYAAEHLNCPKVQRLNEDASSGLLTAADAAHLQELLRATDAEAPDVKMKVNLPFDGTFRPFRLYARALWSSDNPPVYLGSVGLCRDIKPKEHTLADMRRSNINTVAGICALMRSMELIFDTVRLVDVTNHTVWSIDEENGLRPTNHPCYAIWGKSNPCQHCSTQHAFNEKTQCSKLEFCNGQTYEVVSRYLEVDGVPCVLEMVSRLRENPLLSPDGQILLREGMNPYSQALYRDVLTNAYNRRYFKEQSDLFANAQAVAMLDVDNFKSINDTYSHQAGDEALRMISSAVMECIRSSDVLIRYGGDEFLLLFPVIPQDIFRIRLEEIRMKVMSITLPSAAEAQLTLSIGGVWGIHPLTDAVHRADLMMYEAKRTKNRVVTQITQPVKNNDEGDT